MSEKEEPRTIDAADMRPVRGGVKPKRDRRPGDAAEVMDSLPPHSAEQPKADS